MIDDEFVLLLPRCRIFSAFESVIKHLPVQFYFDTQHLLSRHSDGMSSVTGVLQRSGKKGDRLDERLEKRLG